MISINRIFTLIVLILTTSISDVKSQSISTIGEIYNFEIGDIFHYEIESTTSCFKTLRIYKKAEISNRYYSTNYDTVFYVSKIKQLYLDDYAAGEWPDYYTDSAWYSETDNVLKFYTSLDAFLYSEEAYWNQTYIDSMKYNGRKINVIRDPESTCCSEAYADGIGQVSDSYWSHSSCNSHSYKLQYFKKGNEEWGTPLDFCNLFPVYQNENINFVSIDTSIWKNKILWNKTPLKGTASYNIYKESNTGEFNLIGNVSYADSSMFIDTISNSELSSFKYKISVIDTCGHESEMSPYHQTINLNLNYDNENMVLSWNNYIDESGNFVPLMYYIFKESNSQMILIDSTSTNLYSNPEIIVNDSFFYMVGVKKITSQNNYSFSNKIRNIVNSVENYTQNNNLKIYPNPLFGNKLTIEFDNRTNIFNSLIIRDIFGRELIRNSNLAFEKIEIEMGNFAKGVYFLEIFGNSNFKTKILVQ